MNRKSRLQALAGQTMIEYIMIVVLLLATVPVMAVFLRTFRQYSMRTLELAASEYP